MKRSLLALALVLAPLPLASQVSIGAGLGAGGNEDLFGVARHVQVTVPVTDPGSGLQIRAEALYQDGTFNGSPLSCERVDQFYCLGRTDEQRIIGAGLHLRMDYTPRGSGFHAYLTPVGVGMYHRRTRSTESEGPTGICTGPGGEFVECPNNPGFASYTVTRSAFVPGLTTGLGAEMRVGPALLFAEGRLHWLLEGQGETGAVPLTIGVSF